MKRVKLLSKIEMENLTTERLLAYKKRIMQVPEGPSWDKDNVDRINKISSEWQETYNNLKDVLATREHVK
jgi:hypothetical protein